MKDGFTAGFGIASGPDTCGVGRGEANPWSNIRPSTTLPTGLGVTKMLKPLVVLMEGWLNSLEAPAHSNCLFRIAGRELFCPSVNNAPAWKPAVYELPIAMNFEKSAEPATTVAQDSP